MEFDEWWEKNWGLGHGRSAHEITWNASRKNKPCGDNCKYYCDTLNAVCVSCRWFYNDQFTPRKQKEKIA